MNERIENILKHDLTTEQTEWMLQSFQEISFDSTITSGVNTSGFWDSAHPTTSLCKAINFDKIARLYCNVKGISYQCNSSDALYIVSSLEEGAQPEIYWIEFKNGEITNDTIREIQEKISCESRILQDAESLNLGVLDVRTPILREGTPNFNFGKKLRELGIPANTALFEQEHAHFILVYNEEKKVDLLKADIDAICDAIEAGQYTDFVENYNKIKGLPEISSKIDVTEGDEEKKALERYLKKNRNSKKMQWFKDIQELFGILGDIADGRYRVEEEKWKHLSSEEYRKIIEVLKAYKENSAMECEKCGLNKMIGLMQRVLEQGIENKKLLSSAFADILELSPKPVILIIEQLRKYIYLENLNSGEYLDILQIMDQNPVLKPYEFTGSNEEYLKERIEEGTFDTFVRECRGENQYDATLFLNVMTRVTVWPAAFFRFGLKNGFWYKDAKTYSRREFKENFIDGICKVIGDGNAVNFAT